LRHGAEVEQPPFARAMTPKVIARHHRQGRP
jgi:hypothetical protein